MKSKRFWPTVLMGLAILACGGKSETDDAVPANPAVPGDIKLHKSTETSLAFQWTAVEGASAYQWRLLKETAEVQKGSTVNRNIVINDLTEGTTYRFSVRSVAGELVSDWSAAVEAATQASETPVDPPTPPVESKIEYAEFAIPAAEEDGVARAFPGAEGGGMYATGGRGGKVLHVTTLEDSNAEGTLRWACTQNYPRIIVFDVAGIIELKSQLQINRDNCTIAGQTAPGDGICLKNYTFRISASNVVVRFIRCRMGDEQKTEDDAIQVMSHDNDRYTNIVIDHCSISWSTDECASFYGMKDFTFSWNIVSESLRNSVHGKGTHGYGGIWGGTSATYSHNLLAHHDSRNPRIDHDYVSTQRGPVTIADNVVYNWSGNTCYGGEGSSAVGGYKQFNFVGNYYKPGPVTPSNHLWLLDPTTSCSNCTSTYGGSVVPGHFYMTGNVLHGKSSVSENNWTGTTASSSVISKIKSDAPFTAGSENQLYYHSAAQAFDAVLAWAGASFVRDAVDTRIARETQEGSYTYNGSKGSTKGLIDTQTDVGGWPEYQATEAQIDANRDSDADGMPDWFEEKAGLSKTAPGDAAGFDLDPEKRYTNLEMYLHYIVKGIVAGQIVNGQYTIIQ